MKKLFVLLLLLGLISCKKKTKVFIKAENGEVASEFEELNGRKNGKCINYYPGGRIRNVSFYKEDTLDGIATFYHENGQLNWKVKFDMGLKNGPVNYYDSAGRLFKKVTFLNGKLNGNCFTYFNNGTLKSRTIYKFDMPIDTSFTFFENGNIKEKVVYQRGKMFDFYQFDSLGRLKDSLIKLNIESQRVNGGYKLSFQILDPTTRLLGIVLGKWDSVSHRIVDTVAVLSTDKDRVESDLNLGKLKDKDSFEGMIYELEPLKDEQAIVKRSRFFKYNLKNHQISL